jgi:hypothetical protein
MYINGRAKSANFCEFIDFRLPPLWKLGLCSSGMLRSTSWLLVTEVSEQTISSIFKGQAVHGILVLFLDSLGLKDEPSRLSRNISNILQIKNCDVKQLFHGILQTAYEGLDMS